MGKIRTVKPELFRHERLFEAEQQSGFPLRLIFIGLFTVVDAEGRFRWRSRQLKLDILPYDEINFESALLALLEFGFIKKYVYQNELYGCIPTWRKHQSINQREPQSNLLNPQLEVLYDIDQTMHKTEGQPQNNLTVNSAINNDVQDSTVAVPDKGQHMQDMTAHVPVSLEMEMEMEMEVEMEGKWKNQHSYARAVPDPVTKIFSHGQAVMNHPKAVLDKQRRRFIQQAMDNGYSADDLCQAITGCSLTPHNQGQNDRGERYDGLHLILRSADQIDRFIRNAQHPPKLLNKSEQRLSSNIQAAQTWLQQEV